MHTRGMHVRVSNDASYSTPTDAADCKDASEDADGASLVAKYAPALVFPRRQHVKLVLRGFAEVVLNLLVLLDDESRIDLDFLGDRIGHSPTLRSTRMKTDNRKPGVSDVQRRAHRFVQLF